MVAIANISKSLYAAVAYNEKKLKEGVADLLQANGYAKDIEKLTFSNKLQRLQKQADLFPSAATNCIHISLNFDTSECLSKATLKAIAARYMEGIGFTGQPYLLYEHRDAGHQHVHIVSTTIKPDGTRIATHNIGRNQSSEVRRQIEKEFSLVKADDHKQAINNWKEHVVNAHAVRYGKEATKGEMATAIKYVFNKYKFTTLQEYNTVLRSLNVTVSQGKKDSRTYQHKGLFYRALQNGKPVGKPIKASDFYFSPTMKKLEDKFKINAHHTLQEKRRITNAINYAFLNKPNLSMDELVEALSQEAIQLFLHKSETDIIFGLTYIDHTTGAVFNGRSLGANYSANAIQKRCNAPAISISEEAPVENPNMRYKNMLEELIQPEKTHLIDPNELHNDRKKRRKILK